MNQLIAFGEPLGEISMNHCQGSNNINLKFAGDVYNALIYAKHLFKKNTVATMLSAVGSDDFSQMFRADAKKYDIDDSQVITMQDSCLGLYSINVDEFGERNFNYWRAQSAASKFFDFIQPNYNDKLNDDFTKKTFLFSGISLGILNEHDIEECFKYITHFKKMGYTIAFDPNFREALWETKEQARKCFERAYELADIILAGLDDHDQLWGHKDVETLFEFFSVYSDKEVVIKANSAGTFAIYEGQKVYCPFVPAPKQVDTTAAGDAFAGSYLAARLNSHEPHSAMHLANQVAGFVVQHKGAIVPLELLDEYLA